MSANHVVIFYDRRGGGKSELPSDTTRLAFTRQVQDLDEQRAKLSAASGAMTNPASSPDAVRQACRDYWAIGMLPRLAEPRRTLSMVKSDLCATDPNGIRYGNRIGNPVIIGSYGQWDLRPRLRTLGVPLLVVHGEEESIPMDLVEEWVTSMPSGRARSSRCLERLTSPVPSGRTLSGPRSNIS